MAAAHVAVVDAVIACDGEERRAVLLAVLQMHHHRIVAEVRDPGSLGTDPRIAELGASAPCVLVLDVDLESDGWVQAARGFLGSRPNARSVLITPSRSGRVLRLAQEAKVGTVVNRPFSIPQLLESLGEDPAPPADAPKEENGPL